MMNDEFEYQDELPKSKTKAKQEMHQLQDLGRQLTELSKSQLAEVPLEDDLREAIDTLHRIKSNEARRRQMQFIGKLMRSADSEAIEEVLDRFRERDQRHVHFDHMAEDWRKRLLEEGKTAQSDFFDRYPGADHQQLRQLIRDAQKEIRNNKPPASQRKLFRFLRDLFVDTQES